jgi:hypothetical protein
MNNGSTPSIDDIIRSAIDNTNKLRPNIPNNDLNTISNQLSAPVSQAFNSDNPFSI